MKKKWFIGGIAVLAVGGLAAGLMWSNAAALAGAVAQARAAVTGRFGKDEKRVPPLEFSPAEVTQPLMITLPQAVEFSGPLVAPNSVVVRAKAAGTLVGPWVAEGSRVAAGQLLGRIDLADLGSRLAEREANLQSAQAALAQAERTQASNERLAAQAFISPNALDSSRAQLDAARAQANQAAASLETTRAATRDTVVAAPITGIVAKRHALPGEKVAVEQQLLVIVDLRRLELAGMVGTHEVGKLAAGMPVQVRIEGVAAPVTGRLARIAPATEPGTRSIGVTVEIDNPAEAFRAGQYALAQVTLPDDRQRLTVPLAAVSSSSGQDQVWVIEGGLLVRRAVTLGRRDAREGRVEVLRGLDPGAQLLAMRFDNLREGAQAQVVAGRSPPVASTAASAPSVR